MEKPTYFIDAETPWDSWNSTDLGLPWKSIITRCEPFKSESYPRKTVEVEYPGFVPAVEMLYAIDCDEYLVTDIIKFCIVTREGVPLDQFLVESQILTKTETALTIGLSHEDIIKNLVNNVPMVERPDLPDNLAFVV